MRSNGVDHWPGVDEGPVGRLLAAATADAFRHELLGEEAAASAFRTAAAMPVPPAVRPRRAKRVTIAVTIQAAGAFLVVLGGVALAARTGMLPNPLVDVTTALPQPPSANPSPAVTVSITSQSPLGAASSGPTPAEQPVPASLAGLCRAYQTHSAGGPSMGSDAFAALVAAAGSVDRVPSFCADILADEPVAAGAEHGLPTEPPGHSAGRSVALHS